MATNSENEKDIVAAVQTLRNQLTAKMVMPQCAAVKPDDKQVMAKAEKLPADDDDNDYPNDDESASIFLRHDKSITSFVQNATPDKPGIQGKSLTKSKNRIKAWLIVNRRYVCHASKTPFDEDAPSMVQLAHILLPKSSLNVKEKKKLLERYAFVLGIQKEYFGIHSRLFMMPLYVPIHMKLDYRHLFFLPLKPYLQLSDLYLAKVIEHWSKNSEEECTLWQQMKDGELFDGLFQGGAYYPYMLISSPFATHSNVPIQLPDPADGKNIPQYKYIPPPYRSFTCLSHVHPLAVTINAKQALEYGAQRERRPEANLEAFRQGLVEKMLSSLSVEASNVLTKALEEYGMNEADLASYTKTFSEVIQKIGELETMWEQKQKQKTENKERQSRQSRRGTLPSGASSYPTSSSVSRQAPPGTPTPSQGTRCSERSANSGNGGNGGVSKALNNLAAFLLPRQPPSLAPPPSPDTPAGLIAEEWQQRHSSNSKTSLHHLRRALSSVQNHARKGVRAVTKNAVKKGSAATKTVGRSKPVMEIRSGAIQNVA